MSRGGMFGWSYPPGCSGPPDEDGPPISELEESVLSLLEDAGVSAETCDAVMKLIDAWQKQNAADDSEDAYLRSQDHRA